MAASRKEVILKPNKFDKKFFHIETKITSQSDRRISGFASTRFPDRVNDVVEPGALAASMGIYMKNPVVLLDHEPDQPIGKIVDWQVNSDGLFVTAEIMKGTQTADEAWAQIEFGARRAFSIGFIPREIDFSAEFPTIKELELLEISVVSIPANRESLFSIAKALELGTDLKEIEAPQFGWEKTKSQLTAIKSVLNNNYDALPTSEKIFVDDFALWLQNRIKDRESDDNVQLEADIISLETELLTLE